MPQDSVLTVVTSARRIAIGITRLAMQLGAKRGCTVGVRIFTSVIRVRSSPSVKGQTSWQLMQIAKKAYRGEACAHSAAKARWTGWKKAEVQGVPGDVR